MFYNSFKNGVKCKLCPNECVIKEGNFGICSVRTNKDGKLKTINYGEITSMGFDPIEKKPLYHFKPGRQILSVGSFGCNFKCEFCQNYSISQYKANSKFVSPEDLISMSIRSDDNIGIAFTYNEPSIWYEYIYDTAKLLKSNNLDKDIVLITNGYIQKEPLVNLLPYIDAMNIDLKSFNDNYYKNICGGKLNPVLETIETAVKSCHVEITTLLIDNQNNSEKEVEQIANYLSDIDKDIPLHLSRYFPNYKMSKSPTEINNMLRSKQIANKYLNYVYLGNLIGVDNSTYCPSCGALLIDREKYYGNLKISQDKCLNCGCKINIVL